jgi:hypothetical protein
MKKILISIVAALMTVPSFAQFTSGGFEIDRENIYYGIRFGGTLASISSDTKYAEMGTKLGMTLGGVIGIRLSSSVPVFLESGLYYTERGGKEGKYTCGYNNLEIPLLIKYGFHATDEIAVLPFVGPYFAYGISGKTKKDDGLGGIEKVSTYDDDEWMGLERANMGFKFGCGAEYNHLYLEIGYQLGVTNISKMDDVSAHSSAFFANFGVNF